MKLVMEEATVCVNMIATVTYVYTASVWLPPVINCTDLQWRRKPKWAPSLWSLNYNNWPSIFWRPFLVVTLQNNNRHSSARAQKFFPIHNMRPLSIRESPRPGLRGSCHRLCCSIHTLNTLHIFADCLLFCSISQPQQHTSAAGRRWLLIAIRSYGIHCSEFNGCRCGNRSQTFACERRSSGCWDRTKNHGR